MKHFIILLLILIYFFACAFLENGFSDRIVFADINLLVIALFGVSSWIARGPAFSSKLHMAALPLFASLFVSTFFSILPERAAFELLVMAFSYVGSYFAIVLIMRLPEDWVYRLCNGYVLVIGLLAAACLVDYLFLPGLLSSRQSGGLQGPMQNTGQSGSFFGVHLAVMAAMVFSGLVPRRMIFVGCLALVALALVFTLKRASNIGIICGFLALIGLLFSSPYLKEKRTASILLMVFSAAGAIGYAIFLFALENVKGLQWRFSYKFSSDKIEDFREGFFAENYQSAMAALSDRPFFGVGLDNVRDIYQTHEIHSTYLGVLAYAGLIGIMAYSFFMYKLLSGMWHESKFRMQNKWAAFQFYLFALTSGQMVSWIYTYHLRKREFWILVLFTVVAAEMSRRARKNVEPQIASKGQYSVFWSAKKV